MRFFDEILNDNFKTAFVNENTPLNDVQVTELTFNLDENIKENIEKARREHLERCNSVEFKAYVREGFGKTDCKKVQVGPDAVMQLGFQIAHLFVKGTMLEFLRDQNRQVIFPQNW